MASFCSMEPSSLAATGAGLEAWTIGFRTLRFAFGRGPGPAEFPSTAFDFAVSTSGETAVPLLAVATDARPAATENPSAAVCAVSSQGASKFSASFDERSLPLRTFANVGFGARSPASGVASDTEAASRWSASGLSGTRLSKYSTLWMRIDALGGRLLWRLRRTECRGGKTKRLAFIGCDLDPSGRHAQVLACLGRAAGPTPDFDGERRGGASQ